ncbi:MAG TPA: hypothetical protein VF188_07165 [Longimicrobiales bacterium]
MRRHSATLLLGLLAATACATSRFDQHFEAQRYEAAIRLFEADPELQQQERALFRAAVAYALPGSPVHDPARAREMLERFLTRYPDSPRRAEASRMLALLRQVEQLERRVAQRTAEAEARRSELDTLRSRLESLERRLQQQTGEADLLRQVVRRLEADLRQEEERLRALREELRRLKEIDLKPATPDTLRSPPPDTTPPNPGARPDSTPPADPRTG